MRKCVLFASKMATANSAKCEECISCFRETKYSCITCYMPVCNLCSFAEFNEEAEGWVIAKRVGYCPTCKNGQDVFGANTDEEDAENPRLEQLMHNLNSHSELNEGSDSLEEDGAESKDNTNLSANKKKKKPGRKAQWTDSLLNDMVDIIVNNEYYKRKLIFVNMKNQKNAAVYESILKELKKRAGERGEEVLFTAVQLRTKFKKAIAECKKVALTVKTATGIERFQNEKGYGPWFHQLYTLVKTRDSCQPWQAIDPSSPLNSSCEPTDDGLSSTSSELEKLENDLFVPIMKTSRKRKKEDTSKEVLEMMKKIVERDPMKDYLEFAREEAERARQQESRWMEIMMRDQNQSNMFQRSHQVPQFHNYGMQVPASQQENSNEIGKPFYQY